MIYFPFLASCSSTPLIELNPLDTLRLPSPCQWHSEKVGLTGSAKLGMRRRGRSTMLCSGWAERARVYSVCVVVWVWNWLSVGGTDLFLVLRARMTQLMLRNSKTNSPDHRWYKLTRHWSRPPCLSSYWLGGAATDPRPGNIMKAVRQKEEIKSRDINISEKHETLFAKHFYSDPPIHENGCKMYLIFMNNKREILFFIIYYRFSIVTI